MIVVLFAGCRSLSGIKKESSIRDILILSAFHLRINDVLSKYQLDAYYVGPLSCYGAGTWPESPWTGLLGWEVRGPEILHDEKENGDVDIDTSIANIWIEPGCVEGALAVCEIDSVTISVVYYDSEDRTRTERILRRRGLPSMREILAPLDIRCGGKLSHGSSAVTRLPDMGE